MSDPIINELIQQIRQVRDEKDALAETIKTLNEKKTYLEELLVGKLQGEGLQKASSEHGTASIKDEINPSIKDWDAALAFILDGHRDLLKKDIKGGAYRALLEDGVEVPGVESFTKTKLSFRRK